MKDKWAKDLVGRALENFYTLDSILDKPRKIIIPVSGGTDSAVAFKLLSMALPGRVTGVYARSAITGQHSGKYLRCEEWFKSNGHLENIVVTGLQEELEQLRWAKFLSMALADDAVLASSRTKTEDILGTYSLASRVATYLPIVCFWKYEIMLMAESLGIPKEIIDSSRQIDIECGRTEEMVSMSIEDIDQSLMFINSPLPKEKRAYLESLMLKNSFKSNLPIRHM